ncbi:hypothetical protein N7457_009503 [Penicillium paradoxum]|uniref:uncharacterized protein n=1 Tax=Penicillium paradoxum TaxID=176176 RepID=UPI00254785B4|nr:uncharacterized protein N7457_009503 [Penicillium paradoxum]KAJ5774607.1 hypothetical protein N7457_009503 [Penicillium paradoxum]
MLLATWSACAIIAFAAIASAQNVPECAANCLAESVKNLTYSRNATATLCHWPVRDKSLVAPIATAVTGALALAFISIRVGDCIAKKESKWADLCAVLAFVSATPLMGSGMGKDVWTLTEEQITNMGKASTRGNSVPDGRTDKIRGQ